MGKLNIFVIVLANPQAVYLAGQVVQGHVTVELNEEMKMRGIRLKFKGHARVHWSETHSTGSGKNRRTHTKHYSASEDYFDSEILLFGRWPKQEGQDFLHPVGRHSYPFAFQLPPNLPSSFEGAHGFVRYHFDGVIDKPWKFDHKTKAAFTVISHLDLNQDPSALQPLQGQNSKTLCCLCCASGPISAVFRLDRRGYVPGEAISINAEVDNKSNRQMDSSFVSLNLVTIFHATTKSRTVSRQVAKISHGLIEPGDTDIWVANRDRLVLPPLPPSYLRGCTIIDIQYILEFHVDPSGPSFDLIVPLEVLVGTVPLYSIVQQNPPMFPPQPNLPFLPPPMPAEVPGPSTGFEKSYRPSEEVPQAPFHAAGPSVSSDIPNMPPPSYSECVFGKVNIKDEGDDEHTRGNLDYAPVYTYYDWGHTPSAPPPEPQHQ
ncbi:arrestin domain-containing protein 3-like [Gigantopelta aegis]|uniref:arrestin domain-containing protein 3-like n=1 Tax=Gigantopelta aegis TaxID=1735272 RepID=UPI001B88DE88|nr:arrestin domain-containing protein 3-like [Gigantopelta aegis]